MCGLILRNGMGAENFAWSIMFLFMPLTCVYYPVTTLPVWLQPIAWALPPTYVFEGMRELLIHKVFRGDLMLDALALNALFLAAGDHRPSRPVAERPTPRIADADRRISGIATVFRCRENGLLEQRLCALRIAVIALYLPT